MPSNPPLILVTNDDGPDTPGLLAAVEVARRLGEPLVVCPTENQTCMSRAYLRHPNAGAINPHHFPTSGGDVAGYTVSGAPCQVVSHALIELAPRQPDICLCGINKGENLGYTVHLSGTVAAAAEAANHGVPGLAVSLGDDGAHFGVALDHSLWAYPIDVTTELVLLALKHGLGPGVSCLNVNIPSDAEASAGWRVCPQSSMDPYRPQAPGVRDLAAPHQFTFAAAYTEDQIVEGSDLDVFWRQRSVAVTPLAFDLTARGSGGNVVQPFANLPSGQRL
ncbi:hypothetical protein E2K80_04815 [Rhodophyticola sp. CCM32]|uniref:5'/3'-nucleotidase SurE n=1 Tax=Rhodophyticola sp. CCM32 TaxID=2916397 RepID=UPI00107FB3C9|nr:5'/3'-nucleotidase SurE [Rhodophyticola sp. CCM32]QBY00142.1 hypothetical protein E2K80_04815 [Rhodophyticola sp. CCM32]